MNHSENQGNRQDSSIYINNSSGQVNISKDQSIQNPSYVVGNNEEKEEKLRRELEKLIALLEKETQLDQSMRTELDFTSRALLEDVRAKQCKRQILTTYDHPSRCVTISLRMKGREIFYESFKTRIVEKATARLPRERFECCEMVQEKWNSRASILVLEEKRGCFIGSKDGDGHLGAFVRRGDSIFFVSASADGSDRISRD